MAEDLFGDIPAVTPALKTGPDMDVALKFLRKLRPGRAVHNLVARKPDTFITLGDGRTIPDIKGITLDARDEEGIRDFIRRHTARGCDLYYSVNEVSPHTGHKKASADTIVRLHGVYIDVDPRKAAEGENPAEVFAQERWRLLAMAKSLAGDLVAPPTYIVDSGSGIQAVWLVDKPVDKTELLEARFRAHCYGAYTLHREAGADSTVYNIDRILRLPGTVNFQSEKKRKQGRQEAPTRLLSWTGERYPTEGLDAVSPYVVPPRSGGSGGAGAVKCDWPMVEGIAELADVDEAVRERLAAWRSSDSKNEALWSGRFREGGAQDETGSGLAFTLIGRLKRSGLFTVTEAGMLCRAWGLAGDHPVDARDLERCWGRSAEGAVRTTAEDDFEVVEVGAAVEANDAKLRERRDAMKARRQVGGLGGETADGGGGVSSGEAKPALTPEEKAKKAAAAEKRKKAAEARRIEKKVRMDTVEAERQHILEEAYPEGDAPDAEDDAPGVEILPPQKKTKQPSQAVKANGDFWTLKTWKATMSRRGEEGEYHASHDNVMMALENIQDWYGMFSFDAMANVVLVTRPPPSIIQVLDETGPGYPRPVTDPDAVAVARWFQRHGLNKLSPNTVQQCIDTVAHQHAFHPIRQYLNSLQWDGVPRLSSWVHRCLGTPDNEYNTAVGRMYLISMVARVFKPGCKADYVIILEGTQGKTKSTACDILAGEWFSDSVPVLGSKDSMEHLHGIWLAELAELSSMNKSDTESVKAFLTRRKDKYRPSYGRRSITAPRQCVFVGTTNKKQYLRDDTGSRRFWPIATGMLDLDALTAERDQMFAEAVAAFNAGEHWWPDREFEDRVIRPEQEARYESDAWEEGVAAFLQGVLDSIPENRALLEETRLNSRTSCLEAAAKGWTTVAAVAHEALGLPVGRVGTMEVRRITPIMERLGWGRVRTAGGRFWRCEGEGMT